MAYSCPHCNQNKGSDIATFLNDESINLLRFFNLRKDNWFDHFAINNGKILSLTSIGMATINILNFNQIERIILRKELIEVGLYPSK